jgi:hypothetical protein
MNKINEALSKLLPEEQVKEVTTVIEDMFAEAKAELDQEYNEKL